MREFTPPPPPPPGTPPAVRPPPAKNISLRLQRASGAAGGSVVSWPSLDHGGPVVVRIDGNMDPGWSQIPIFTERFGNFYFFFWHPTQVVAPPAQNSILGTNDSAMLAVLEASLPAMNQQVADSTARARNAPPPAPPDPDSKRFWRVKVDWSLDTDQDGTPDWAEFEVAARGTGMLVPGVVGDAFNEDTNNDGIPDGLQINSDGDCTPDALDINPSDNTASFTIGPAPRYALFPITNAAPPENAPWALQINDKGRVLYEIGTWCGGVWTRLVDPGGIPPFSTGGPQQAHAYAINDHDVILGQSGRQVGSLATEFASVRCFWSTPTAAPLPVKSSQELGAGYAGHLTSNIAFHGDLYRPQLSNDGRFTADYSYWESNDDPNLIGREITEPAMWTLPTTGTLSTHTSLERSIIFHGDPSLSWGYSVPLDESGREVGERTGKVLNSGGATPILPFIPENVVSVEGRTMAFPLPYSDKPPVVLIENKWKDSPFYQGAFDISKDGVAIGLPARFQVNGKWLNIEKAAPGISAEWQDASVRLLDTTASGWILAQRTLHFPTKIESAAMLPIRAEGQFTDQYGTVIKKAAGVDDISVGSTDPGPAVSDRIWIMAPKGGPTKTVTLKAPLNPETPLTLTATGVNLGGAAGSVTLTAPETILNITAGTAATGTDIPLDLNFGTVASLSKPLGVKVMKSRKVKVTRHLVASLVDGHEDSPNIKPAKLEMEKYLNDIYGPQMNVTFDIKRNDVVPLAWDTATSNDLGNADPNDEDSVKPGNKRLDFMGGVPGTEEDIIDTALRDRTAHINIYVLGGGALTPYVMFEGKLVPASILGAYGFARRSRNMIFIDGDAGLLDILFPGRDTAGEIRHTIAHEIGHCIIEDGHPDQGGGPAALPGLPATAYPDRLMVSGSKARHPNHGNLLVKGEWDAAEVWLKREIDDKIPQ